MQCQREKVAVLRKTEESLKKYKDAPGEGWMNRERLAEWLFKGHAHY